MAAPLLVAIASMITRMESSRLDRALATAVGFVGVLVVLRPSLDASASGLAFALACAAFLASRDLVNRRIPAQVPSVLIAVATTIAVTFAGLVLATTQPWLALETSTLAWIAAAAVFAALGNYAVVAASRGVDLSVVAPFRYSSIVWALVLGFAFWGEIPDWRVCTGIALIAASGGYMLRALRAASDGRRNAPPTDPGCTRGTRDDVTH